MSFYTSLTGLNAATTQLGVTSNNIANVATTGFKRSRADFGDIFATSPLQKASTVVGKGTALKQVSQEFSQGNIELSGNTLDLAVTGEGFFPLKSSDGQDLFTRNGSFLLDDKNRVVNSAGQFLNVATVDSLGKADFDSDLTPLKIDQVTVGEAIATSTIDLSINFPAEGEIATFEDDLGVTRTKQFNPNDPSTYSKSSAITIYDDNGNDFLLTAYYARTQVASAEKPSNKWQSYVYLGDQLITPALSQATSTSGEPLYVNKYGQIESESQVPVQLRSTNETYQKFNLDDLSNPIESSPAKINGSAITALRYQTGETPIEISKAGLGLSADLPDDEFTSDLASAFKVAIDVPSSVDASDVAEQGYEMTIDLSGLAGKLFSGKTLATEVTRQLNEQLGSRAYFDLSKDNSLGQFTVAAATEGAEPAESLDIDVVAELQAIDSEVDLSKVTGTGYASAIQTALNRDKTTGENYTVAYSLADKGFSITRTDGALLTLEATVEEGSAINNQLLGLTGSIDRIVDPNTGFFNETSAYDVFPNGDPQLDKALQRYGVQVEYDEALNRFSISSGSTGDSSNIRMYDVSESVQRMLGFVTSQSTYASADLFVNPKEITDLAERGLESLPAIVPGNPLSVNPDSTFEVDDLSNEFSVTVDTVTETFVIPEGTYNLSEFMATLERRINAMADREGRTVNGVTVSYDPTTEGLKFTSGTTGNESFLQVSGSSRWGLVDLDPGLGSTSTFIQPETFSSANDLPAEVYVRFNNSTGRWEEYSASPDLEMLELTENQQFEQDRQPQWRPLFLDKGELTFDTSGNLVSPLTGVELDNVVIGGSGNSLQIDIDYSGSTQFTGEFSVNSQSQNGQPNGNLVGLDIGDDGLVTASYSNGSQQLKGKIILANFSTPNGLRQLGDSTFLESAESGAAKLAEPGSAGVGTIRAGARERANLDLTSELVDLITAQRNFQANAKGLETSTTLTQTIINIRG